MLSRLLNVATLFTELSDTLTAKWPEIVAILSSTTVVYILLKIASAWIISKIKRNANKPLVEQLDKNNAKLDEFEIRIEEKFNQKIEEYTELVKKEMQEQTKAYKRGKAKAYKKIVKANEKAQKVVDNAQEEVKAIKEEIKAENKPTTEVAPSTEEVVETLDKVAENENNGVEKAKTTKLVAKKVITND